MVVGFNHNFRYKGEVYHIQTEDSGVKNPNIVTLLYQGGTILASKKTSYADIGKIDNLGQVVEELMKEQHKDMLRGLKSGEFDVVIKRHRSGRAETSGKTALPQTLVGDKLGKSRVEVESPPAPVPPAAVTAPAVAPKTPPSAVEGSLDEVILSYLLGDEK